MILGWGKLTTPTSTMFVEGAHTRFVNFSHPFKTAPEKELQSDNVVVRSQKLGFLCRNHEPAMGGGFGEFKSF